MLARGGPYGRPAEALPTVDNFLVIQTLISPQSGMLHYLALRSVAPTDATVLWLMPAAPGVYGFRLFAHSSYGRVATNSALTVPPPAAFISVNRIVPLAIEGATPGWLFDVGVLGVLGSHADWMGLYCIADPDTGPLTWAYMNGSTALPIDPLTSATRCVAAPSEAPTYEFRLCVDNGYGGFARSNQIAVGLPSVSVTLTSPFPGSVFPVGTPPALAAVASPASGFVARIQPRVVGAFKPVGPQPTSVGVACFWDREGNPVVDRSRDEFAFMQDTALSRPRAASSEYDVAVRNPAKSTPNAMHVTNTLGTGRHGRETYSAETRSRVSDCTLQNTLLEVLELRSLTIDARAQKTGPSRRDMVRAPGSRIGATAAHELRHQGGLLFTCRVNHSPDPCDNVDSISWAHFAQQYRRAPISSTAHEIRTAADRHRARRSPSNDQPLQ